MDPPLALHVSAIAAPRCGLSWSSSSHLGLSLPPAPRTWGVVDGIALAGQEAQTAHLVLKPGLSLQSAARSAWQRLPHGRALRTLAPAGGPLEEAIVTVVEFGGMPSRRGPCRHGRRCTAGQSCARQSLPGGRGRWRRPPAPQHLQHGALLQMAPTRVGAPRSDHTCLPALDTAVPVLRQ